MAEAAVDIRPATMDLPQQLRVIRVLAGTEFKLKYAGSALGYVWSLAKPLAYFSVLYVIFGLLIRFSDTPHYPLFLLLGLVLYTFFAEATGTTMSSLVARGGLIKKLAFPRITIPISGAITAGFTFAINL